MRRGLGGAGILRACAQQGWRSWWVVRTSCAQRSSQPCVLHRKSCQVGVFGLKIPQWGQGIPEGKCFLKNSRNGEEEQELLSKNFYVKIKLNFKKSHLNGSGGTKDELKGGWDKGGDSFYCWPALVDLAGLHLLFLPALGLFWHDSKLEFKPPSKAEMVLHLVLV